MQRGTMSTMKALSSKHVLSISLAILLLASAWPCAATTYYVNDSSTNYDIWCTAVGNDGNNGTSAATPKASVQAVIDTYDLDGGDSVQIDTGSYTLTTNTHLHISNSDQGVGGNPLVFEASPYGVVMDRNDTSASKYVWEVNAPYITIRTATSTVHPNATQRYMRVTGGRAGIWVGGGGDYCRFYRLEVSENSAQGFYLQASSGAWTNSIVNCTVWGHSSQGIYSYDNNGTMVSNCTLYGNGAYSIEMLGGKTVLKNTAIHANGAGKYCIKYAPFVSDYNNLFTEFGARVGIHQSQDRVTLADWQAATSGDANSIDDDPLFVDALNGDFHPRSEQTTGAFAIAIGTWTNYPGEQSPLIDAGDTNSPYSLEPWPNGDRVNIGAYGDTEQASKFFINTATLTVDSHHGGAVPAVGEHSYDNGTAIDLYVTNSLKQLGPTQFVCTGWSGSGSVPTSGSGTNVSITITNESTISWLWKTQFWLTVGATAGGSVDRSSDWHDDGSDVALQASAGGGYDFVEWRTALMEDFAAGNGTDTNFNDTLVYAPVLPGPLTVIADAEVFTDQAGSGTLSGHLGGSGTIDYNTGAITLNCYVPPGFNHPLCAFYYYEGVPELSAGDQTNEIISIAMAEARTVVAFFQPEGGTDSDGDSIPDADEGGSTPYVVGVDDRTVDSDGDGNMNATEYHAGTNPSNTNSFFAAKSTQHGADGAFLVNWSSESNKFYRVEKSTNLMTGFFPFLNGLTSSPPLNTCTDTVTGGDKAYYRIEVEK